MEEARRIELAHFYALIERDLNTFAENDAGAGEDIPINTIIEY